MDVRVVDRVRAIEAKLTAERKIITKDEQAREHESEERRLPQRKKQLRKYLATKKL